MLNLSDKELDRLSREAAQEHDPGDVLGPRSWDKLVPRLDNDLGKTGINPFRGGRFPFYFAPAFLLVLVVSLFYVRQSNKTHTGSGSPPPDADMSQQQAPAAATPDPKLPAETRKEKE